MPSPIAHTAVGYAIMRLVGRRANEAGSERTGFSVGFLALATFCSLLPDLPSVVGLFIGNFRDFHNNWEHSLLVAPATAGVVTLFAKFFGGDPGRWFKVAFFCYVAHVVMDLLTIGRGVMILWPLSGLRFSPPFPLFYGVRWSEGWLSVHHLWTLLTEAVFALVVLSVLRWSRFGRTGTR